MRKLKEKKINMEIMGIMVIMVIIQISKSILMLTILKRMKNLNLKAMMQNKINQTKTTIILKIKKIFTT